MELRLSKRILFGILVYIYFLIGYSVVSSLHVISNSRLITAIDNMIPLIPFFVIFYLLGYIMPVIPVFMIKDKKKFYRVIKSYLLILTLSFLIFLIYPMNIDRNPIINDNLFSKILGNVHFIDTDFNTFPSLHVSLSLFSYLIIINIKQNLKKYLLPILILIVISTLFVKQHLFIDVIGGLIIGYLAYLFYKK